MSVSQGHNIPEKVIRRRFIAGLRNLEAFYKSEVDHWVKYDNLGDRPVLTEWGESSGSMKDIRECSNPVMRGSMAAIQRAAQEARRIAIQTGTELITMRNGKICSLSPEEIAKLPLVVEPNPVAPALRPSEDRSDLRHEHHS